MSNKYNNNKHDPASDNAGTNVPIAHGELRRGRLSMIKNNNPFDGERENEYVDDESDSRGDH